MFVIGFNSEGQNALFPVQHCSLACLTQLLQTAAHPYTEQSRENSKEEEVDTLIDLMNCFVTVKRRVLLS